VSTESSDSGVRSVQRALDILALLTEERPVVSIRDIVDSTGLAKTTVIRLVQTLEQNGLLWGTPTGYMAGPGLWRWTHLARSSWELPPETRRQMRDLGARQRETVNLYMLRDIFRVCVAQQESPQPLRHVVHVGDELPLWSGASSKVLLRDAPESLLVRIARNSPYGEGHGKRLREWIDEAAHAGWAESHGEREEGLSAVAVPIMGRSGAVIAALSLSGPTVRFGPENVERFAADLRDVGRQISERGFDHPLSSG
jgi:DNA-binding IclR family transcriptional regulator